MQSPTVAEYARRWLVAVEATRRPQTARNYRWALERYIVPRLGAIELRSLSRAEVRDCTLCAAEHLGPGSARLVLAAVRAMLGDAVDEGLIKVNPGNGIARRMHLGDGTGKVKAMTKAELTRFLARDGDAYGLLWYVMVQTGLRIGEAAALTPSDIDLEAKLVRVRAETSKGRIERLVELSLGVVARLRPHIDGLPRDAAYVFHGPRCGRVHLDRARQAFKRQLNRAGLPASLTPHCLRHTYASLLVAAGAPLEWLRRQLGHTSIKITVDLYGRHAPMDGRKWLEELEGG
jgi:integrase